MNATRKNRYRIDPQTWLQQSIATVEEVIATVGLGRFPHGLSPFEFGTAVGSLLDVKRECTFGLAVSQLTAGFKNHGSLDKEQSIAALSDLVESAKRVRSGIFPQAELIGAAVSYSLALQAQPHLTRDCAAFWQGLIRGRDCVV